MRREIQLFVRRPIEKEQPLVSGEDGRWAMKIALMGYESIRL
jgi:hypothetical protein